MRFSELAKYFEKLEKTASRLAMTEILADLFMKVSDQEIPMAVNISLGQLRPKFDRLEFNLAEKMVLRAVAEAFGMKLEEVKKRYKEIGDVGGVVVEQRIKNKEQSNSGKISVNEVYERLIKIAEEEGQGSQERKVTGLAGVLGELDEQSAKYVARMVVGKLRLGFSDMTILDALSWMETGGKSKRKELEFVYQLRPDVGEIARLVKKQGIDKLEDIIEVELGVPVVPALAQRLKTADEMIEKMGKVAVEPKYDGTRVQIHFDRKGKVFSRKAEGDLGLFTENKVIQVRTFTRNLDETTHMFPEIQRVGEWVEADELILDSEAVGFDPKTNKMLPFQETIKRKRKHGVAQAVKEIPLKFFVFDVLYKDGKSLVHKPFYERRKILEKTVRSGKLMEVPELLETDDSTKLRKKHSELLKEGLEGALVKKWDGVYEPGRKGWSWVKFKEAEENQAKLSDTVDAVVMGLYRGKGKRTVFGVGAFLVGVRADMKNQKSKIKNQKSGAPGEFVEGQFYTISKVGTGLTDEQWRELHDKSMRFQQEKKPKEYVVDKNLDPDVWLAPGLVVEIAADEITKSPIHTAGVALRFPRLVRFRDDKSSEQVTSLAELGGIV